MQPLNLGTGTPSSRLKSAWRKAGRKMSLRDFVKEVMAAAGEYAVDGNQWFKSKMGKLQAKRSEKNVAHAKVLAAATKATRTKAKK